MHLYINKNGMEVVMNMGSLREHDASPSAWSNLPKNVSCEYGEGVNTKMGYIELKTEASESSPTRNVRLYSRGF